MKFICTHGNLMKGLAAVSPLAGRNPQLPVLQKILLEVKDGMLHLTCTDLEMGAHAVVGGKVEKEGSCVVPAKQLLDYVQQLPSAQPVVMEKKKRLLVSTIGFNAQFPVVEADDFPLLPTPSNKTEIKLNGRLFCRALSAALFAAAKDEARPELHSLFIQSNKEEVRIAATDSFRLSEKLLEQAGENEFTWLLPVSTAQEIVRLFGSVDKLLVLSQENYVSFQGDGIDLSSRLIDGAYPNYQQIIPTSFKTLGTVKREELLRALKVVGVFMSRDSRRVKVALHPDEEMLKLSVEGGEVGQGSVDVAFEGEGEAMEALFNINYLLEGVQHVTGEKCKISLGGSSDPIMIEPTSGTHHIYIVMPIQV